MKLDLTKAVMTRDGRAVRILCTDAQTNYFGTPQPIVGLIDNNALSAWSVGGAYMPGEEENHHCDLVNVGAGKRKVTVEVRLYRRDDGSIYSASIFCGEKFKDAGGLVEWSLFEGHPISTITIDMEYDE